MTFNRRVLAGAEYNGRPTIARGKPDELAKGLLARWKVLEEQLPNVIRNLEAEEEALLTC